MEMLEKFIPAFVVAVFMFIINRQQLKRDKKKDADQLAAKRLNQILTKGVVINIEASSTLLTAVKKLKDEKGKALLNGEVRAINEKVEKFNTELEEFLIQK